MIKNKKIWAIVLSILMLVVIIIPSAYINAAGEFTVAGSTANVKAGEEVSVDVNLVDNPGVCAINLYYTYDTNYFTLTNIENKVSKFTMTNDVTTVWDATSNYTEDGTLATLTFKVAENAPSGDYEIAIHFIDASNDSFQPVTAQTTAAVITVEALPVAATGITLNKNSLSLVTGANETLVATVSPDNATNKTVIWSSSDSSVAKVDANGKVEALKKGTVTITATTEDGGFQAECTVAVVCGHSNTTTHPAVTSTCLVQGNVEYVICDDCGEVISGSDDKLPLGGHTGGMATCENKAVCTVCQQPYDEYAAHKLTNHPAVVADHNQGGNIEYWTCDVCDKFFGDADGTKEITETDTKTDIVPHSHSTTYSYNNTQHWRECGCGNKIELTDHDYDNACDRDCNTCDYSRSITHDYSREWSSDGANHWHECTVCHDKTDITAHFGGIATCTVKATCTECNTSYGEVLAHDNMEVVNEKYLKSEATCVSKAVYYKSCSMCGATGTETFENGEVVATNHTGETEIKDAIEATCTTDGYSGDIICADCGEKLEDGKVIPAGHDYGTAYKTDAENHWKECECGDVIEKTAHTLGDWIVTKEASTTEKGSKERVCSVCGYKEVEEIPVITVDSPKTGDYSFLYLWIALLAISCLGVVEVVVRKKRI